MNAGTPAIPPSTEIHHNPLQTSIKAIYKAIAIRYTLSQSTHVDPILGVKMGVK